MLSFRQKLSLSGLLVIITVLMASSCLDLFDFKLPLNIVKCESDCYPIDLRGTAYNTVTGSPMKGVPVRLRWVDPGCFLCFGQIIHEAVTNSKGEYHFTSLIDTTLFSTDHHLIISLPYEGDHIAFPPNDYHYIWKLADTFQDSLNLELAYPTDLEIKIERVESDNLKVFDVSYSYGTHHTFYPYHITITNDNVPSSPLQNKMTVRTAAEVPTFIHWKKKINSDYVYFKDTIICPKNKKTRYTIQY